MGEISVFAFKKIAIVLVIIPLVYASRSQTVTAKVRVKRVRPTVAVFTPCPRNLRQTLLAKVRLSERQGKTEFFFSLLC